MTTVSAKIQDSPRDVKWTQAGYDFAQLRFQVQVLAYVGHLLEPARYDHYESIKARVHLMDKVAREAQAVLAAPPSGQNLSMWKFSTGNYLLCEVRSIRALLDPTEELCLDTLELDNFEELAEFTKTDAVIDRQCFVTARHIVPFQEFTGALNSCRNIARAGRLLCVEPYGEAEKNALTGSKECMLKVCELLTRLDVDSPPPLADEDRESLERWSKEATGYLAALGPMMDKCKQMLRLPANADFWRVTESVREVHDRMAEVKKEDAKVVENWEDVLGAFLDSECSELMELEDL